MTVDSSIDEMAEPPVPSEDDDLEPITSMFDRQVKL